jgi:hypothetical protein
MFNYFVSDGQDLRSLMMKENPAVMEFLCLLITDDSRDSCSCACSNNGCFSYQQLLRGFFRYLNNDYYYRDPSGPAFAAMIDALQYAVPERVSQDQRRNIALQTLWYLTFDSLDISHTCHKNLGSFQSLGDVAGQMEDEEIQEIHEEAELISQMEDLVAEFSRKYDELGLGLHNFIKQYVQPRLNKIVEFEIGRGK